MDQKVIDMDVLRINKNCRKICKCEKPHFEIDVVNRAVQCRDCGAYIDSFEALLRISGMGEELSEYQRRAIEKCKSYGEEANKEFRRMCKNRFFKDMEKKHLKDGLHPVCPHCEQTIDLLKINRFSRPDTKN